MISNHFRNKFEVRVRADTDLRRLSGLVNSRFRMATLGLEESCRFSLLWLPSFSGIQSGVSLWTLKKNPENVTFFMLSWHFLTSQEPIVIESHGKQSHWEDGQSLSSCMATQCSRARNGTSGMCLSLLCRAPTSAKSKFGVIQWGSMHFAACEQWVAHSARKKTGSLVRSIGHTSLIRWKFN